MYSDNNGLPAIGFSEEAILMLQTYSYPGNVRELENMVERAVLLARGRVIMPSHFPQRMPPPNGQDGGAFETNLLALPFHTAVGELEKKLVENAIRLASGNKTAAANRLQINRRLLYQKMVEHQIKE
jgi:DNA-binding NtrC family response regulator